MACAYTFGVRVRGGLALRMGLWMDGTRYTGAGGSAAEAGGCGVLPLCAEPNVLGFFCRVGWAVGDLRTVSGGAILLTVVAIVGVNLFVMLYEEPHLRRVFGAEYVEYRGNVPRWVPRLQAWTK